jgi:hypothetical protein
MRVYFVLIHVHKYNFICGVYSFVSIKTHYQHQGKIARSQTIYYVNTDI